MTQQQRSGQQQTGAAAARMRTTGRWVLGHGLEEALVAVPAVAAVALPTWWAQAPAAAAAAVAAGLWARHEWRTHRRVRQGEQHHLAPTENRHAAAITSNDETDSETDMDGPAAQREVSIHG